ncbi:MAG: hypothetical protein MI741_02725 [Rhodospirillales bacterium]|nr:hypothetical protein [Rhodospirillales bacterium]
MRVGAAFCFLLLLLAPLFGAPKGLAQITEGWVSASKAEETSLNVLDAATKARERGDDDMAAQIYTRAIEDTSIPDRHRMTYLLERGRIQLAVGDMARALADMNAAVALIESEPSPRVRGGVYSLRGFLLADLGRHEEAVQDLQRAYSLRTQPDPGFEKTIEPLRKSSPQFAAFMDEEAERILDAIERKLRELGGWE